MKLPDPLPKLEELDNLTTEQASLLADHFLPPSLRKRHPPLPIAEILAMSRLREDIGYRDNLRGAPVPESGMSHTGRRFGAYHLGPLSACPLCNPWWRRALAYFRALKER